MSNRMAQWYDVKSTMVVPSFSGHNMCIRFKRHVTYLVFLSVSASTLFGQAGSNREAGKDSLRQHYIDAQELQRASKLNEAAEQYRAFLAEALGELAMGYGLVQDYAQAAPLFDEALTLEPESPSLLLAYSQAALAGDPAHAKTLATEFLQRYPGADREKLAQAHHVLGRALLKLNQNQDARKELEAAVALDPTFLNGYDLAVACLDLADEKCAAQIFSEMEKSFGDTAEVHMAFGRAYGDSDFQPRAVTEFRRAIEKNPRLPGAHYLLAAVLLATGDDETHVGSAEAELKKELIVSPHDSMTYAALGKIAATHHNYPEAETYLKKAISLGSQSPDAYLYLGQVYFSTNRFSEAETALRQCIQLTTDISLNRYQVQKAHFLLGRILTQKGQQDAAHVEMDISRELANKTLAQDKSNLTGLTDPSGTRDLPATPQEFTAASSLSATKADPMTLRKIESTKEKIRLPVADSYNNLGAIAASNNDFPNAVTYFKRAAVWNPSLDGLDYNWGRAAFAGSQFAEAVMPLSRYVKSHPGDTGGRSVLGISQFMIGDFHGCVSTLNSLIGKIDLAPQVEYVYAESMIKTGQIALGTGLLRTLEKSHPEIPDVHRSLGEALNQQGEKERATEEFRTAIQLSPRDADSHFDLGKMQLEGGQMASAVLELEEATRLLPKSEKFHEELANAYTAAHRPADAQHEKETLNLLRSRAQSNSFLLERSLPPQ
jgi:tetratricopeptide (TPR) repeat protein